MSTITDDSIFNSTKKVLGVDVDNPDFDTDILMHINSVFSILGQLGIGPAEGFMIEDAVPVWSDFLADIKMLNHVKTYMYLRVRMFFDPPTTSFLQASMEKQISELEWRINVHRENSLEPVVVIP